MARQQPSKAHLFAVAESLSHDGRRLPLPDSIWLSRAVAMAQTFAIPFAFYFKSVVVFIAMSWLFYRAYQVLNKPLEELAGLLGFDIPSCPIIDLAAIKADGAIVHWNLAEKQKHKSTHRFEVHLNGNLIDTLSIHESAATITGLQPGCFYVVRVSLVNNMEFSSKSAPIRFRTKHATTGDFFVAAADGNDPDTDGAQEPVPRVRAYRGLKDITSPPADAVPMTREGSTGLLPKRSVAGRRASPSALDLERHNSTIDESDAAEGAETITQLTEKLDAIRRETEEIEKQAKEEEEEETQQKEELIKERDELKAEATEKERVSRNLKKELKTLEGQNTHAQNERTKHERILAQKKQEREKLKEDMIRWAEEAEKLKEKLRQARQEKDNCITIAEGEKEALRMQQADEVAAIKALDDEVKEKSTEIKKLERSMKNYSPSGAEPEPNLVQQLQHDAEERREWELHFKSLQQQYALAAQNLDKTRRIHAEQQAYLESLRARRRQEESQHFASPPTTERPLRRGDSQRSRRAQSGPSSSDSPRVSAFALTSAPFASGATSTAPMFPGNQHINFYNGMTINRPTDELAMSAEDRDALTAGAPMSPNAAAELLPTDLFGDGDFIKPLPGLGALPGMPNLAAPAARLDDSGGLVPASPVSGDSSSRSASVFASPQVSQPNLPLGSPEAAFVETDGRSIRSVRSNRAPSGGAASSRFSGMFGIQRRAKTASADEGPALSKANSMPRQDGGIPGLDSASRKRNSSISGSMLSGTLGDAFDPPPPMPAASRLSRFNPFASRAPAQSTGAWPTSFGGFRRRPGSPRPGSTHSNELPRPSFDSTRWGADAWPSADAASGARSSPLAFGAGWNAPSSQQSRMLGSRHPSRRPSAQHGGSGPPDNIMEDEGSEPDSDSDILDSSKAAKLGPIGTKPPPGSKKAEKAPANDAPKLNPAAKDFKSFFSGMSLTKSKTRDKDNASTVASSASGTPNLPQQEDHEDMSPPNSRKSKDTRDTRSMTTTESSIAESGRNSQEYLARTPSYTNSDAAAPSPLLSGTSAGKESFMQKLSRKSSSSKFTLPTFKREKSRLDTNVAPSPAPAEEDEHENEGSLSASVSSEKFAPGRESREHARGSGRNWSNVLKLGIGKRGNETPSLSGMSMTSAGADGTDDEAGGHGGGRDE
ncbi:uncharacterized protein MYCFIDRAFT_215349 [Pseudocercospora fijiensis CIRAD86]|uniref:Fibronectin type-III domain-containing protein n=1 Tax=Pseudocercospora fijiensis (strain CIRAD86) TaxID=383855 RepID=M2Z124_PSEFD|nr:uncharacterized protein MYCFIDRAFT_215349 [Pseudocercospora fijiensis CIRAD86]EME83545.1 hypothetical protein MYCFIDRAFT_215349 [Pseudocercospora fijiensis CIRAD86]